MNVKQIRLLAARELERQIKQLQKELHQLTMNRTSRGPYKRKHWQQTAEGKKKISKAMKQVWAKKHAKQRDRI